MNLNPLKQKLIDPAIQEESQQSETSYQPPVVSVSKPPAQKPEKQSARKGSEQVIVKEEGDKTEVKVEESDNKAPEQSGENKDE